MSFRGPRSASRRVQAAGLALAALLGTGACGSPAPAAHLLPISQSGGGAYEAALAATRDGFVAAWYDLRDGNAEIYARWLAADGRPLGPERRLTEDGDASYEPSIDVVADDLVVAWYDKTGEGRLTARLGLWTREGREHWAIAMPPDSRNPVVRSDGRRIFCAWIQQEAEGDAVWGGWWDTSGAPLGAPQRLAPASTTTWNLNAALDASGAAWVAFDAVAGTRASELFLVRGDGHAPIVTRLTADDGFASTYPDVAFAGAHVALTWFDTRDGNEEIYVAIAPLSSDTLAFKHEPVAERFGRRVTTTEAESIGAYIAWHGQVAGLVWSDRAEGQHEVYFRPFDTSGAPLADPRRLTVTAAASLIPAIRAGPAGFGVVWNEYDAAGGEHDAGAPSEIVFTLVEEDAWRAPSAPRRGP